MFGGGFGNGKTTAAIIKALKLAYDYPGSNGLIARATYPKLNSTIRKAFEEWCPPAWIARNVNSKENLIELKNGSIINFSYIAQGGKQAESSTSNLLSATYDWIVVDQVEDPEITHKDFLDLLGRLRGNTTYTGDDETMPTSGPRWVILMCNPTRNWVYRELVKPLHDYQNGIHNPSLLVDKDGKPIIELFEGSTYDNAANLPEDFIATQEAAYKGQMRERFLLGNWGAYEGLVYPDYDPAIHLLDRDIMLAHFEELQKRGVQFNITEAYDHGLAKEACYGLAFTDADNNVFLLDGIYAKERKIFELAKGIKAIREKYGLVDQFDAQDDEEGNQRLRVLADPAIFRRASGSSKTVGVTTSELFREEGIKMVRGNNDVANGIAKVQSYMYIDTMHEHPIYGTQGAPRFYVNKELDWFDKEIVDYFWKKDTRGDYEDTPMDRNDHAMDMMKYLFTHRPRVATFRTKITKLPARHTRWQERDIATGSSRKHRYG